MSTETDKHQGLRDFYEALEGHFKEFARWYSTNSVSLLNSNHHPTWIEGNKVNQVYTPGKEIDQLGMHIFTSLKRAMFDHVDGEYGRFLSDGDGIPLNLIELCSAHSKEKSHRKKDDDDLNFYRKQ